MDVGAAGRSDVGRVRDHNEDAYVVGSAVFAVADGLGGHAAGEVASAAAVRPVARLDSARFVDEAAAGEALAKAVREANRAVWQAGQADPAKAGMGTTLTAALALPSGRVVLAHVGDSRAYLARAGSGLQQLTTDHTYVEELVAAGRISRAQAARHPERSVLTRALGLEPDVAVDRPDPVELEDGDRLLLCSDGLTEPLDDETIARVLAAHDEPEAACAALVAAANDAGGPDNITVVLLQAG